MGIYRLVVLIFYSYYEDIFVIRNDFFINFGGFRVKVRVFDDFKFDNVINNECKVYSVLLVMNEVRCFVD